MSDLSDDVRAKVLIAEDDAIVALDLQGMVMRLGYDVVAIVDSGQAAIAAAQRFLPNIILLDMILNGSLDGIDVAREIHKTLDVPVIFCTSSPDLSHLIRAKEISYAGYLLKPINPDSLSTTLDTALYKYKLEKRVAEAEEKFRGLADKGSVLQLFFDQKVAFEWIWNPKTGSQVSDYPASSSFPVELLQKKINAIVASQFSSGNEAGDRISVVIDSVADTGIKTSFAVIGVRNSQNGQVHGMLIHLDGGNR